MEYNELKKICLAEEAAGFSGWNFSHLRGRWKDEQQPWDYEQILKEYLKPEHKLLDMGTGGGEFLLSLNHPTTQCSVTEGWEPNVKLCRERLEPLGICVRKIDDPKHIPYADEAFDIVINRHEAYDLNEVYRILKPEGIFITQQVGGSNDADLSVKLGCYRESVDADAYDLHHAMAASKKAGFKVIQGFESYTPIEFYDLGALVYFAHIIEWEFGGFSVETHFEQLCTLQEEIELNGCITGMEHRYLICLKK